MTLKGYKTGQLTVQGSQGPKSKDGFEGIEPTGVSHIDQGLIITQLHNPNETTLNQLGREEDKQRKLAENFRRKLLAKSDVAGGVLFGALEKKGEFEQAADTFIGDVTEIAAKRALGPAAGAVASMTFNSLAPLIAMLNPGLQKKESNNDSNSLFNSFQDKFYKDYELATNAPITALITTNLIKGTPIFNLLKWILRKTGNLETFRSYLINKFTPKIFHNLNRLKPNQEFLDSNFEQKIEIIYGQYESINDSNANFYAYGEYIKRDECSQNPGLATAYTIARLIKLAKGESYYSYLYDEYFDNTLSNLYAILQSTKVIEHYELNEKVQERIHVINKELDEIAEYNPVHLDPQGIAKMISALKKSNQTDLEISNILKEFVINYYNAYKKFNSRALSSYTTVPTVDEIFEDWIYEAWEVEDLKEHFTIFIFNQILFQDKPNVIAAFLNHLYKILNLNTPQEIKTYISKKAFTKLLDKFYIQQWQLNDDELQKQQEIIFSK